MSVDALLTIRFIFTTIWRMFTSWHIPGTHTTPAEMGFFLLTAGLVLRYVKRGLFEADDTDITIGGGVGRGRR